MSDLTGLQAAFIEEYLKDFNGVRAAERAGYSGSYNTLAVIAHENLRKPKIKQKIDERMEDLVMAADEALARLSEIARGEYSQYIQENGSVDIEQIVKDGKAHLIKGISETKYGTRYEFHDMHSALRDIAKAQGVFVDKSENLNIDLSTLTENQLERLAAGEDLISVLATPGTGGA